MTATESEIETQRLFDHFSNVLEILNQASMDHLTVVQRRKRKSLLNTLRTYRDTKLYPKNTDFPRKRVSYFQDNSGRLCAVGQLLFETGSIEIINSIVTINNNIRIENIDDQNHALLEWLDNNGFTQSEAALIQPEYSFQNPQNELISLEILAYLLIIGTIVALNVIVYYYKFRK